MEWDGNNFLQGQVGWNGISAGMGGDESETGWGWIKILWGRVGMSVISVPVQASSSVMIG